MLKSNIKIFSVMKVRTGPKCTKASLSECWLFSKTTKYNCKVLVHVSSANKEVWDSWLGYKNTNTRK